MKNLPHSASFHSKEKIAPSKPAIKHLAMHAQDAARVEKEISALPILGLTGQLSQLAPGSTSEITALNAEQMQVADQLGIRHEKFLASLQAYAKKDAD